MPGGACDGIQDPTRGFVIRGGREMENHFECLWDLFRSIPSLEHPENSVLDEYYWLNKEDPNYSLCRATVDRGKDAHTDGKFTLSQKGRPGDHEAFPHPGRGPVRQDHRRTSSTTRSSSAPTSGSTGGPCSPSRTWHCCPGDEAVSSSASSTISAGLPDFSRPEIYPVQPV